MINIIKDYNFRIICIGISVILFFNLAIYSYSFSEEILRVPSSIKYQKDRVETVLYLQEHFLFRDEEELRALIKSCSFQDVVKNMPREPEHFLYRSMRIKAKALMDILLEGFLVSKTAYGKIYFVVSPFVATKAAFFPISTKNNYPMENFICVSIQLDRGKVPHLTSPKDITPDAILRIFVFDRVKKTFVDETELFISLSKSELPRFASDGTIEPTVSINVVKKYEYAKYADIMYKIAKEEEQIVGQPFSGQRLFLALAANLDIRKDGPYKEEVLELLVAEDQKGNVLGGRILFSPKHKPELGVEVIGGYDIVRENYKKLGVGTKLRKAAFIYIISKGYEAYEAFILDGNTNSFDNLKKLCKELNLTLEDVTDLLVPKIQQIGKHYLIRLKGREDLLNTEHDILLHQNAVRRFL